MGKLKNELLNMYTARAQSWPVAEGVTKPTALQESLVLPRKDDILQAQINDNAPVTAKALVEALNGVNFASDSTGGKRQ